MKRLMVILLLVLSLLLVFGTVVHGERSIEYSASTEISKSSEEIVDQVSQGLYRVVSADKHTLSRIYDVDSYKNSIIFEYGATYGSGFLIADDLLLTVAHAVDSNHTVLVIPGADSSKMFYGEVVKVDKDLDLALVKLPKQVYKALKFGSPEKGGRLICLGFAGINYFPQKLELTGHEGEVVNVLYNMTNRNNTLRGAVHTTAEHGMSGGAVINTKGEVVGTNDFIFDDGTTAFTRSEEIEIFVQAYISSILPKTLQKVQ